MINFCNVKINELTRNTSILPITVADVKAYSKQDFLDTSKDAFINKMIMRAINGWEAETRFLILDQTFNTSLYNQVEIYSNFKARLTRLNVRSFGNVLYYPCQWNNIDPKSILSTDIYYFTVEKGTTPAIFQLKEGVRYLNLYPVYNNLEIDITAGYEGNNFTNMPQDIKDALAMQAADLVDGFEGFCGFYEQEIQRIYSKYTAYTKNITF